MIPDTDYSVELQLFDVPSDQLYLTYSTTMIQNCQLLMIVINAQQPKQLQQIDGYIQQFKAATKCTNVKGVLVANMAHETKNEITFDQLKDCAKKYKLIPIQCNRTTDNEVGFMTLAKIFYEMQNLKSSE